MPIYSPVAIDYSAGFDKVLNGRCLSDDELQALVFHANAGDKEAKKNLGKVFLRPRKIGCWVKTVEELQDILDKRREEVQIK